ATITAVNRSLPTNHPPVVSGRWANTGPVRLRLRFRFVQAQWQWRQLRDAVPHHREGEGLHLSSVPEEMKSPGRYAARPTPLFIHYESRFHLKTFAHRGMTKCHGHESAASARPRLQSRSTASTLGHEETDDVRR